MSLVLSDFPSLSKNISSCVPGINLLFVAVHEIGHALGLGHSEVLGSIMYPTYGGYDPNLQLHSDDRVIIQYLYGESQNSL